MLQVESARILNQNKWTNDDMDVFNRLPKEYQSFLYKTNGGYVKPETAIFKIQIERMFNGITYSENTQRINEFWSFISYKNEKPEKNKPASILHEHFDRHVSEHFLPDGIICIGLCDQNSLFAISINENDFGAIYYWEWYWRYPWYKDFFTKRIRQVELAFPDFNEIVSNEKHPKFRELDNQLNYATIVKVSGSFDSFTSSLVDENL